MTPSGSHAHPVTEDQEPTTRRRSRRAMQAAVAVLITGLVLSAVSAVLWARTGQANDRKDFHAVAQDVTSTRASCFSATPTSSPRCARC